MQTKAVTVRLQTLDGEWETVGVDRLRGIWPENDSYVADEWGPSKCSFDLRRDPGTAFPDLTAWTPIEVEIGGVVVWDGRVIETPDQEAGLVVNVQGKGWQFHLDDDQFSRWYIRRKLSEWRDARGYLSADLTWYKAAYQVQTGDQQIVLAWPAGLATAGAAAVYLDAGEGQTFARINLTVAKTTGAANNAVELLAGDTFAGLGTESQSLGGLDGTSGATGWVLPTPRRFLAIRLGLNSHTPAADESVTITDIVVYADAAYAFGLKASTLITDALSRATILLSEDRSGIETTTFDFPEFALDGQRTPREAWIAAASVEDNLSKIEVGRRPVFKPKPTAPMVEIGAWPGSEFDGAGNSGEDIYNRAIVDGSAPDGGPLVVKRMAAQLPGLFDVFASPAPDNPSFATNTATWTPSAGTTITRDTVTFNSAPAGGTWSALTPGSTLTETFTGTFLAGIPYVLTMWIAIGIGATARWGSPTDYSTVDISSPGGWQQRTISWVPSSDTTAVTLVITITSGSGTMNIDTLAVQSRKPTLVDRRGFRRSQTLPVRTSLTPELGTKIADVWLQAHLTTPLKGTVKVTGDQAAREITTGASVPPERLLLRTGELLRLSHRVDPDYAAGQGRDGRMVEVTYTPATDSAVVVLDNRRTSHEALLERLAVVVGTG